MKEKIILGCIADDFTGASDAASFLVKGGMKTLLFNGVPSEENLEECQAVVIALKTRTQETKAAVRDTLEAATWLKKQGAEQLYIKYCSTFDSTREGNIGPVMDALLEEYDVPCTILCPALPVNGRTVKDGHLYVNGVPLHESPMKDHPLTPMWDSDIKNLMEAQSRYTCVKVSRREMAEEKNVKGENAEGKKHWYVIPDYTEDEDAKLIVERYADLPILSGGSGILTELARYHVSEKEDGTQAETGVSGAALLLAGSCSKATREQIAYYQKSGKPSMKMDPVRLMNREQKAEEIWGFIEDHKGEDVLIYSSDSPEAVKEIQKKGREKVAELLESTTAALARKAVEHGYQRIIVAGGETSGAVTKGLQFSSYIIGESVAPGVPVMTPRNHKDIRLVLKSGNFGQEDFFEKALLMTGKEEK